MTDTFHLGPQTLTFDDIKQFFKNAAFNLQLSDEGSTAISKCRTYLDDKINGTDGLFYGINTGFGFLQNVRINKEQLNLLQDNLITSHACGMGEEVPEEVVKLMLIFKIKSLSYGHSGVSLPLVQRLADYVNHQIYPVVYTQGSLGASGDLAPLSHLCLPLIGKGEVRWKGEKYTGEAINEKFDWKPIELQSKEGLALINGTQFMSAYGLHNLLTAERLIQWADCIAALSFDAFDGNTDCFNENIHRVRPHQGQIDTATILRAYLQGSSIAESSKQQVQDPYSFRCIPQVHGATKDTFDFVQKTFLQEINAVTDNPNVFPDEDLILSGGNFHGQPLALAHDYLCIAMSEIANISERRTFQLLSGQRGLPLFLAKDSGLNSGLMIPQYTAAGIVSENKQLCTPSSVDSIPSSNNQEDHVSMGANAATKCHRLLQNVEKVLAIELLNAAQALEFRRPKKSSTSLEKIVTAFRGKVSFNDKDRILYTDMVAAVEFIRQPLETVLKQHLN